MNRAVSALLDELLQYFPCVALTGPRQCGKTTLLKTLPPPWRHFDLERAADFRLIQPDPDGFLLRYSDRIAIDEAQLLPELFPALRVAIDERRDTPGRFVLTGSSMPELQRGLSESLAGRVALVEMAPLSFAETEQTTNANLLSIITTGTPLQESKPITPTRRSEVRNYWFQGGYPEPWIKSASRFRSLWRENYVRTYLERDLRRLFPGIDEHRFRNFLGMLASLSGTVVNMSDLARSLSLSQPTIRDYIDIAHGTFLWRRLQPFDKNVTKRIVKHPYGHYRDSGLLHYLMHIPSEAALQTHAIAGRSWQSMVSEEILRTLDYAGVAYRAYYYRTAAGAEVDLVLEGDFGVFPIEIKLSSTVTHSEQRSIRDFMLEHRCSRGLVVNNSERLFDYGNGLLGLPFLLF